MSVYSKDVTKKILKTKILIVFYKIRFNYVRGLKASGNNGKTLHGTAYVYMYLLNDYWTRKTKQTTISREIQNIFPSPKQQRESIELLYNPEKSMLYVACGFFTDSKEKGKLRFCEHTSVILCRFSFVHFIYLSVVWQKWLENSNWRIKYANHCRVTKQPSTQKFARLIQQQAQNLRSGRYRFSFLLPSFCSEGKKSDPLLGLKRAFLLIVCGVFRVLVCGKFGNHICRPRKL